MIVSRASRALSRGLFARISMAVDNIDAISEESTENS